MMRITVFIWLWFIVFMASGQICLEEKKPFSTAEFVVYVEHIDYINQILYQVGSYEPKGNFAPNHTPIHLRVKRQNQETSYFLDHYHDTDMFSFPALASENLTIVAGRYGFYVYDIPTRTLSAKQIPGLNQYESEDAISGRYGALTLFDKEQFLLGNVQGFGIFCFDISHPAHPVELTQYTIKKTNGEQFYAFFHQRVDNPIEMIMAQQDTNSKYPNIDGHYRKVRNVQYAMQDITIDTNESEFPILLPSSDEHYLLYEYFTQISNIKKNIYTDQTDEFCSSEYYEYENGIRYYFTDFGPCEQCGHSVTEIFIPNFNVYQGFIFILSFYRDRSTHKINVEEESEKVIRLSWGYSEIKIIPHQNGILIIDDVVL